MMDVTSGSFLFTAAYFFGVTVYTSKHSESPVYLHFQQKTALRKFESMACKICLIKTLRKVHCLGTGALVELRHTPAKTLP